MAPCPEILEVNGINSCDTEYGKNLAALAKRSGVEQADISRMERGLGNPTEETLAKIAKALGVRLAFVDRKNKVVVA